VTGTRRAHRPLFLILGILSAFLAMGTPAAGQKATPPAAATGSPGAPAKASGGAKEEYPLHISAAQMEADQDQRLITFKGQVRADYADYTLYSDKLLIFYKPDEKKPMEKGQAAPAPAAKGQEASPASPLGGLGGDKIDRVEAWGNVRCVQQDRVATGEKAIYYKDKDDIVLLGHPQVWRGEDHLRGSKITMHLDTNKVEVESSPEQRVEANLYRTNQGGKTPAEYLSPGSKQTVPPGGRRR